MYLHLSFAIFLLHIRVACNRLRTLYSIRWAGVRYEQGHTTRETGMLKHSQSGKSWRKYAPAMTGLGVGLSLASGGVNCGAATFSIAAASTANNGGAPLALDFDGHAGVDINLSHNSFTSQFALVNFPNGGAAVTVSNDVGATVTFPIASASAARYHTAGGLDTYTGGWGPNRTAMFGFRTSGGNFAWIRLQADGATGTPITSVKLLDGAYNGSVGAPIHAVPEPSAFALLGLLAAGAGGVVALKKKYRKQESDTAEE